MQRTKKMEEIKTAILLANLGSPESHEVRDVGNYLREFLMDERVIDLPYLARTVLVKGIIVPFRARKSAAKYKSIWINQGSPLIHISRQVQKRLADNMKLPVELCMRYANPTPAYALDQLNAENPFLKEVILVPLYPHYAMSSYETAVEHVRQTWSKGNYPFQLKVTPPFFNDEYYLDSLAESIRPFLNGDFDHLLFSYHGIPRRHVLKSDPTKSHCLTDENCCTEASAAHRFCYRHQISMTTKKVAEKLCLPKDKFSFSFQSRLGTDAWLKPYTVEQLANFPKQGIKNLVIVCPAFVSDCLETLEEIRIEGRLEFLKHGGESFGVIPCLNEREDWIDTLAHLVNRQSHTESVTV